MNLKQISNIFFIGIGGIGMSALARYFKHQGKQVFGYDKTKTLLTKKLEQEGIDIHYEDKIEEIPKQIDLVVYTPAIPDDHKQLVFLKAQGHRIYKRAEVLGMISRNHKTLAVAGTHGKTTTSTILAWLLHSSGVACHAFLGGIAQNFESNFVAGNSDWMVAEADEYDRSFLHLDPDIAIINSMDADHLDIYLDEQHFERGFTDFALKLKPDGLMLMRSGLELTISEDEEHYLSERNVEFESFGIEQGSYRAKNLRVEAGQFVFDLESPIENIENLKFTLPGQHNVQNATAAIAVAQQVGIGAEDIRIALATFKGINRRFDFVYKTEQQVFIDDYAHHPTELKAAITAARTLFPDKKITGIFQPHLYSRTRDFVDGFAASLDLLDEVFLLDIYPARELPIPGVSSKIIFDKMKLKSKVLCSKEAVLTKLKKDKLEILLTLGAGNIDTLIQPIHELLKNEKS